MPSGTIYLIAGCNGVGKTTFAKEFLPSIGVIRSLNADEIARGLLVCRAFLRNADQRDWRLTQTPYNGIIQLRTFFSVHEEKFA
jgi:2-phosphoglycerate kinase